MAANREEGIADEVVDRLLEGRDPATVFETGGLVDELKKRLAERMLNAEMDHHLGTEAEEEAGNHRNGYSGKTVLTDTGKLELVIPRDRHGRFDPVLIGKYRRRFAGFDDKIIALYARGLTTREIAAHVGELYGVEISPDLVSAVTDAVLEEAAAWQSRGLEATYAIVFFDAIRVKIRNEGHLIRYSMHFAAWKERRPVAAALKPIYQAESAATARARLEDFDRGPWGQKYPAIAQSWRRNWEQVIPFFAFAPDLRKILYTTNAIESLNAQVRKAVRVRGHFPSEEAATKLIWLVLRNVRAHWKNPPISWHSAKTQLAIQF